MQSVDSRKLIWLAVALLAIALAAAVAFAMTPRPEGGVAFAEGSSSSKIQSLSEDADKVCTDESCCANAEEVYREIRGGSASGFEGATGEPSADGARAAEGTGDEPGSPVEGAPDAQGGPEEARDV